MIRSHYEIVKVDRGIVWIKDMNGERSVTNDAERVVKEIHAQYPNARIIYCDSMFNWDELKHRNGEFTGFSAARHMKPESRTL